MTMPQLARGRREFSHDLVFAITLVKLDRKPEFLADAAAVRFDIGQRLAAVDLQLAFSRTD